MNPGVVITVYNEARSGWRERENADGSRTWQYEDELSERHGGNELLATLDDLRATEGDVPVVVVDDASDDGCCDRAGEYGAELVRHKKRYGIGYSRTDGVAHLPPECDTVMFLDAHMRVSGGCVRFCSELALEHNAVVWPDTRGLRDRPRYKTLKRGRKQETWTGHGARPRTLPQAKERGVLFRYSWQNDRPVDRLSRTHALISPGYTIPLSVWRRMPIGRQTRGFGGNEPMIWVKAFFLDVPILHTCDAMVRHLFRAGTAHYTATNKEVYRNMAILARTAFSARTWDRYWWPAVFEPGVTKATKAVLDSDELWEAHLRFQHEKRRSDVEFWRGLTLEPVPEELA